MVFKKPKWARFTNILICCGNITFSSITTPRSLTNLLHFNELLPSTESGKDSICLGIYMNHFRFLLIKTLSIFQSLMSFIQPQSFWAASFLPSGFLPSAYIACWMDACASINVRGYLWRCTPKYENKKKDK